MGVTRLFGVNVSEVQLFERSVGSYLAGCTAAFGFLAKSPDSPAIQVSKQIPSGLPSSPKWDLPENGGTWQPDLLKVHLFDVFSVFSEVPQKPVP